MQGVSIILLALFAGYSSAAEKKLVQLEPEKLTTIFQGVMPCLIETPLNPEAIMQLRSGKQPKDVDEKKLQKLIYCAFIKTGYGKKNGHIKVEKALDLYPASVDKEEIRKAMEECNKREGKEPMETAAMFLKCYREESPVKVVL